VFILRIEYKFPLYSPTPALYQSLCIDFYHLTDTLLLSFQRGIIANG
jgi:hypothetical protein